MHRSAWLALPIALAVACSASAPDTDYPFSPGGKTDGVDDLSLPVAMDPPVAGWFDQQIDHPASGESSPLGLFAQRYWYSTQFASGPDSPVLFYFCGEAPCDPWYATTMADEAAALHAAVVVLEHRYYGQSLPYTDFSLDEMKYLTIHNALEDAATFERWAKGSLPLAGPWIAVGGSYAGMLAAFYRETHPELVVGAWSSSAPVDVSLSFWGYDTIVTRALGEDCASQVRIALGAAEDAWDDPDQRDVVSMKLFGFNAPARLADFLSWVSAIAESAAQYGNQAGLCAAIAAHPDAPLDGMAAYNHGALRVTGGAPHVLAPGATMPPLRAPVASSFAGQEWFYQVCTEVGFYQTHSLDQGNSVVSWLIDEDYWADLCQTWVGTTPAIDATRATYYDAIYSGQVSNLFFVNGTLDPWSALSFTDPYSPPDGVTVALIQGGSHCSDLNALQPWSSPDVFAAHRQFYQLARQWLGQ